MCARVLVCMGRAVHQGVSSGTRPHMELCCAAPPQRYYLAMLSLPEVEADECLVGLERARQRFSALCVHLVVLQGNGVPQPVIHRDNCWQTIHRHGIRPHYNGCYHRVPSPMPSPTPVSSPTCSSRMDTTERESSSFASALMPRSAICAQDHQEALLLVALACSDCSAPELGG